MYTYLFQQIFSNKEPLLDELRRDFTHEQVREAIYVESGWPWLQVSFRRIEWAVAYFGWLFDECSVPLDLKLLAVNEWPTYGQSFIYPLDWVVYYMPWVELVNFFLKRKAPTALGLDTLVTISEDESIMRRLIQAGATPVNFIPDCWVTHYYHHRQKQRAALVVLLGVVRKAGHYRYVARDLWRIIGQRVWNQVWDHFETKKLRAKF